MRVLVAMECSGIVRDSFRVRGHDAYSCDLKMTETPSAHHLQGDALQAIPQPLDFIENEGDIGPKIGVSSDVGGRAIPHVAPSLKAVKSCFGHRPRSLICHLCSAQLRIGDHVEKCGRA